MANRAKNKPGLWAVWTLLILGAASVTGLAVYIKTTPADRVPASEHRRQRQPNTVSVYRPKYVGDHLQFEARRETPPSGQDERVFAINKFLHESGVALEGAELLSCEIRDQIAYLNFNRAFDRTYGTEDEQTLVKGILQVMSQFEGFNSVQILIEGKPMQTMGNIDLTEPLPIHRSDR